jgi:pheromone alpha factor receptor
MSSQQSNQTYSPPADPFTQPVTILDPTGAPFNVTMDQFAWFHYQMTQMAVSRGAALGATVVMLLAVAFLTQRAKRGSPVFALNVLALTLNVFRTLFMVVWVVGPYTNPYAVLTNDWAHVTKSDIGCSIAVPTFTFLALGTVLSSLLLQVRVALSTARRRTRHAVLVVCGLSALGALGTEMAVMVINIKLMILDYQNTANDLGWAMLLEANSIATLLNMVLFTLIFVAKLGFAIWQQVRRLSSAQRFGPLQVLFIMGVQTLIVPSKLSLPLTAPADSDSDHARLPVRNQRP